MKNSIYTLALLLLGFTALHAQNYLKPYIDKAAKSGGKAKLLQKVNTSLSGDPTSDLAAAILQRGYSADDFPSLAKALQQAERDTAMVIVALNTKSLAVSDTLRRTAALWVYQGGRIKLERGVTFKIQGHFFAGPYQVFEGDGNVTFDDGAVEQIFPQWWGAVGDSATNSTVAFQKAAAAFANKGTVRVPSGVYRINNKIKLSSNTNWIAERATIISSDTSDNIFNLQRLKNIHLEGFTLNYVPHKKARTPNTSAIYLSEVDSVEIMFNRIYFSPGMGIQCFALKNAKISFNHVEGTLADGIHVANGPNTDLGRQLWSENVIITNNTVKNAGDDKIAVVSYERPYKPKHPSFSPWRGAQLINRNIIIANNIVEGGNPNYRGRGITVLGGRDIVIDGNIIYSGCATMMTGILVQAAPNFAMFRPHRIMISNNRVYGNQMKEFAEDHGAIKIFAADSVDIVGNMLDWGPNTYGIRLRTTDENEAKGYDNTVRDVRISSNRIMNARFGVSMLSTSANRIQGVRITENEFYNIQRGVVNAESVEDLSFENNQINNCNVSGTPAMGAFRANKVRGNIVVRGNIFKSSSSVQYAVQLSNPEPGANLYESGNVFDLNATSGFVTYPVSGWTKYMSQGSKRIHYAAAAPTTGTWEVGDITFNSNAASGSNIGWVCTAAGTPGTWSTFGPIDMSVMSGNATFDPPNLAPGASASSTITVKGAAVGDAAACGFSSVKSGNWQMSAYVSAPSTVTFVLTNHTGGAADLPPGTVKVQVFN
jgi:Pectate lyase superfamily protein